MRPGLFALVLLFAPAGLSAQEAKPPPKPTATALTWLAGQWRMERAGRVVDEHWMVPGGGVMLGMARTIAKGRVLEHEFMQIREGPGGELYFIAQPSGQKEAAFRISELADNTVTFENKEHDFPQRIRYTRNADDTLAATLEATLPSGAAKRVEFLYRRVTP